MVTISYLHKLKYLRRKKALEKSLTDLIGYEDEKEVDDGKDVVALSESSKLDVEEIKIKSKYANGLINKQEYETAMQEIAKKRWDNENGYLEDFFEGASKVMQSASDITGSFKDADLAKAETTYNKDEQALKAKLERGIISQEQYDEQKNCLEEKTPGRQKEKIKKNMQELN